MASTTASTADLVKVSYIQGHCTLALCPFNVRFGFGQPNGGIACYKLLISNQGERKESERTECHQESVRIKNRKEYPEKEYQQSELENRKEYQKKESQQKEFQQSELENRKEYQQERIPTERVPTV